MDARKDTQDTCSKGIGIPMYKICDALSSEHHCRDLHDHSIRNENREFDNEQDIHTSCKGPPEKWLQPQFVFAIHIREISTTSSLRRPRLGCCRNFHNLAKCEKGLKESRINDHLLVHTRRAFNLW